MFERISRGWELTKSAFHVLRLDPEIAWLPVLAGLLQIFVVGGLGAGFFGLGLVQEDAGPLRYVALFVLYLAVYTIVVFFNAAVIEMANIRFAGGDPVLRDGLAKASRRFARIIQWALVAATVGLLLNLLRSAARRNILARLAIGFLEFSWNVATYFVVPMLVFQDVGPVEAIRRSTTTVKRVWGESLTGVFTTGIVFFLLGLVGILPMFLGISLIGSGSGSSGTAAGIALIALAVLYWIALAAANSAVSGILVAAIYRFSQDGQLPEAFRNERIDPRDLAY